MNNNFNILGFAQSMIQSNKNLPNAPWVGPAIDAIMSGNAQAVTEIAKNLCNTYGSNPQNIAQKAAQRFNIPL